MDIQLFILWLCLHILDKKEAIIYHFFTLGIEEVILYALHFIFN